MCGLRCSANGGDRVHPFLKYSSPHSCHLIHLEMFSLEETPFHSKSSFAAFCNVSCINSRCGESPKLGGKGVDNNIYGGEIEKSEKCLLPLIRSNNRSISVSTTDSVGLGENVVF